MLKSTAILDIMNLPHVPNKMIAYKDGDYNKYAVCIPEISDIIEVGDIIEVYSDSKLRYHDCSAIVIRILNKEGVIDAKNSSS